MNGGRNEAFPAARRARRATSTTNTLLRIAAPALLVVSCAGSPNSDVKAIASSRGTSRIDTTVPSPSIAPTTTVEQQDGIPDRDCAGFPGLDSVTTGEAIIIGDDVTVDVFVDKYPDGTTVTTRFISDEMAVAEGWKLVSNIPDGTHSDSLYTIDNLQCQFGLANVTTGNAVDPSTNQATGLPGMISVWVRQSDPAGSNL
jgi:hypothetical protein